MILKESVRFIVIDLIGDVFYFPVWWYTAGLKNAFIFCLNQIRDAEEYLSLYVWIKNIATPMYAQYDWQGRIISFFMRLVQIIFRTIFFLVWSGIIFLLFVAWVAAPIIAIGEIWMRI